MQPCCFSVDRWTVRRESTYHGMTLWMARTSARFHTYKKRLKKRRGEARSLGRLTNYRLQWT